MLKSSLVLLVISFLVNTSSACDINGHTGILPENNLKIEVNAKIRNDMTKERFNAIINRVDKHYSPIVKELGGKLKWSRKWGNPMVNASAQRRFKTYKVNMYGGLARHNLVTDDGFALVVCHELGHHLGGAPKASGAIRKWASNEGQSDYFATLKCLKRVFEMDDNQAIVANMTIPATVQTKCHASYTDKNDIALCIRISMAGKSIAHLFSSLSGRVEVKFDNPDLTKVVTTKEKHPTPQCRLDTYFHGSLCDRRISDELSNEDATVGTCNRSQGYIHGPRPRCWYKPGK